MTSVHRRTHGSKRRFRPQRRFAIASIVLALAAALIAPTSPASATSRSHSKADVLTQDETGVYAGDGATLKRQRKAIQVKWHVPTPGPGTYLYPTAAQIPPGAPPHPEVLVDYPEVFTLWAFVFNFPDLCSGACDFDDIGDTPARGGIYQLDYTIGFKDTIRMNGKIRTGATPAVGAPLENPRGLEVHVAMAPHGQAHSGDDLRRQFAGAIGAPPNWWVAVFD